MEIKGITAVSTSAQAFGKRDTAGRMTRFFADHPVLVAAGRLLALKVNKAGKSIADLMVAGESVTLSDSINIDGKTLPLKPVTFALNAASLSVWGCPACGSAHGTNLGASRKADGEAAADGLSHNRFFYDPKSKEVFAFSDSCFQKYVKDAGREKLIVSATSLRSQPVAKSEVKPEVKAPVVPEVPKGNDGRQILS